MLCSAWVTPDDLDDDCLPVELTDADKTRLIDILNPLVFVTTGSQWPGACRAILRPNVCPSCSAVPRGGLAQSRMMASALSGTYSWRAAQKGCECANDDAVDLALPWPILTEDADGEPYVAEHLADPGDEVPVPFVRWADSTGARHDLSLWDDFEVEHPSTLRRFGCLPWPAQADCSPADCDRGWVVEVVYGALPPSHVVEGLKKLVYAFAARDCRSSDCALPENVTSLTVHDTTMRFDAGTQAPDDEAWLTGIGGADMLLSVHGQTAPPARVVWGARKPRHRWAYPGSPAWSGCWQDVAS
jgi:hypothetical protein